MASGILRLVGIERRSALNRDWQALLIALWVSIFHLSVLPLVLAFSLTP